MKKAILASLLLGSLALAGCKSANDIATDIRATTATVSEKVKEVQAYAVRACGYLPYAAAIVGIFNSGFSQSVSTVGSAICDAVTTAPLADGPGDRKPRVNGVAIKGQFVK